MKVSTSSLMLASIAFTGSALAVPTPRVDFESPVPGSPIPDDWPESVRSPSIPRSPMPAVRVAGRRRSFPRFKRQDSSVSATGILSDLGDALHGIVGQAGDVVHSLPIVGGLGIRSTLDGGENLSQGQETPQNSVPPLSANDIETLRNLVAQLSIQQPPVQQATPALPVAENTPPIDAAALRSRLQALLATATGQGHGPVSRDLNAQGLIQGIPVAGPLTANLLGGLNLGNLANIEGLLGSLPIVGGLVENGPLKPVGGVLTSVQGTANGVLGSASGVVNNLVGDGTVPLARRGESPILPAQVQLPGLIGTNGLDSLNVLGPHQPTGMTPGSLSNAPMLSSVPAPPPPTPAMAAALGYVGCNSSPRAASSPAPEEISDSPATSPEPTAATSAHRRSTEGEATDVHGVAEGDMHEGGIDAVPGPQDAIKGTLTAPRFMKKMRRRLRGFSVAF
ncbi:hypothetical protein FS842_003851 [Serendipita sp. 407]|nr:hypothetical protein FS842_003851 [Serendipita sp. 407]